MTLVITGVGWQQASACCEWRSTMATYRNTHAGATTYQRMLADNERAQAAITYRLPTESEWARIAAYRRGGNSTEAGTGFRCIYTVRRTT